MVHSDPARVFGTLPGHGEGFRIGSLLGDSMSALFPSGLQSHGGFEGTCLAIFVTD